MSFKDVTEIEKKTKEIPSFFRDDGSNEFALIQENFNPYEGVVLKDEVGAII
eukprot:CAMPEP_0170561738 /NCGR_PEP_ID=MMETSP0211-20121228/56722_1 /TAXON_ID=311385 /ORGANISM="Pseudokeronopsis sp., Strain OXSARD2" /LENGTH=51 /DNA_ID=CAMNT_0010877707 /DNA_START=290 /DNA_END=445 /DNA_ORIENTATION=+